MLGAPSTAAWQQAVAPVSGARHLSPAETARRLGVTVKALRVYERHGLVKPVRTAASWRTYGPAEIARLHQVLTLKRLGLSLAKISVLLNKRGAGLAEVLALQEQALSGESARVERALKLIRTAREKLAKGAELSIDDLTTLTKETTMSGKATPEEMKAIFDPITAKYFTPEETKALTNQKLAYEGARAWEVVIEDAKRAMAKGDPGSPEALAVARPAGKPVHRRRSRHRGQGESRVGRRDGGPQGGASSAAQSRDFRLHGEGPGEAEGNRGLKADGGG